MGRALGKSVTILRRAYFMQNDVTLKDAVLGHGVYPMRDLERRAGAFGHVCGR